MRIQLLMTHGKNNESFKAKLHKQSVGKSQVGVTNNMNIYLQSAAIKYQLAINKIEKNSKN